MHKRIILEQSDQNLCTCKEIKKASTGRKAVAFSYGLRDEFPKAIIKVTAAGIIIYVFSLIISC